TRRSGPSRWLHRGVVFGLAGLLLGAGTTIGVAWRDATAPPRLVRETYEVGMCRIETRDHLYYFSVRSEYFSRKHVRTAWAAVGARPSTFYQFDPALTDPLPERLSEAICDASDK